jgi:hypothetical protein
MERAVYLNSELRGCLAHVAKRDAFRFRYPQEVAEGFDMAGSSRKLVPNELPRCFEFVRLDHIVISKILRWGI